MAKAKPSIGGDIIPSSGEIWRAPAPRVHGGYRYVKVKRVHAPAGEIPTVTLHEVTSAGETKHGKSWSGIPRAMDFAHTLTTDARGRWTLCPPYELAP